MHIINTDFTWSELIRLDVVAQHSKRFFRITQSGIDDANWASLRPAGHIQARNMLIAFWINDAAKFVRDRLRPLIEGSPDHWCGSIAD